MYVCVCILCMCTYTYVHVCVCVCKTNSYHSAALNETIYFKITISLKILLVVFMNRETGAHFHACHDVCMSAMKLDYDIIYGYTVEPGK
jgi:NO-binding membrane sensor protein with MHYT domain